MITIKACWGVSGATIWNPTGRWFLLITMFYCCMTDWSLTVDPVYLTGYSACHTEVRATCQNQWVDQGCRSWQPAAYIGWMRENKAILTIALKCHCRIEVLGSRREVAQSTSGGWFMLCVCVRCGEWRRRVRCVAMHVGIRLFIISEEELLPW